MPAILSGASIMLAVNVGVLWFYALLCHGGGKMRGKEKYMRDNNLNGPKT